MNYGLILAIAFRIIANREEILAIWNKIVPLVRKVAAGDEQLSDLGKKILPEEEAINTLPNSFSVRWLQEALNKLINAGLTVDGLYGKDTRAAVEAYQKARGLVADGWAGVNTSSAIFNELNPK